MINPTHVLMGAVVGLAMPACANQAQADEGNQPMNVVRYGDFGARGDGKTDDLAAIAKAHAHANEHGLPVKADDDATYYIGGKDQPIIIQTDTDFGEAKFIIDDTAVVNRKNHVFEVRSALPSFKPEGVASLKRDQAKLDVQLPRDCVVVVTDKNVRRYIRRGLNVNNGTPQTDVFVVDKQGNVDPNTPIIWDFDQITDIEARPIDPNTLTIKGGRFTTIANAAESKYTYYSRGLAIRRSNVVVDGLEHRVTGEGKQGAPYGGFINVANCANVTVRNTVLTGRKTYRTIGRAGKPVSMGSYDILLKRALNVSFINCTQTNDINDRTYWGLMGSNYCKNIVLDRCVFSRFDAHQGVANATIRNCKLGYMGINAIGTGTLLVENTTVLSGRLINLRQDYGSTWQGEFVIRNCVFKPANGKQTSGALIGGFNDGQHDFGYTCHMPKRITIDKLHIDDADHRPGYGGPVIFANFNPRFTDATYEEKYPYLKTQRVTLKDVTTASGKPLRVSDNRVMFKDVVVEQADRD